MPPAALGETDVTLTPRRTRR